MWPWGHLAFGYILYSLSERRSRNGRPTDAGTVALAVGTQLPDLVDKPLAWGVPVLPGGRSLAHSLLVVAVPLAGLYLLAVSLDRRAVGSGVVVGYLSHLLGDAVVPMVYADTEFPWFLLWPAVGLESGGGAVESGGHIQEAVQFAVTTINSPAGVVYVATKLLLLGGALALWNADGRPWGIRGEDPGPPPAGTEDT